MVHVTKGEVDVWIARIERYDAWPNDTAVDNLNDLRSFLEASRDTLAGLKTTASITAQVPNIGQLITKIGRHPQLILEEGIYERLLNCILVLIPNDPQTPIERRAAQWGQTLIRKSYSYYNQQSHGRVDGILGCETRDYHDAAIEQLSKSICRKLDQFEWMNPDLSQGNQSSAALIQDISQQIAPLVSFPDVHPVVEKLLLCSGALAPNALSERFYSSLLELQAKRFRYPRLKLRVEMSEKTCDILWTNHLPALEHAVMSFIQTLSSRPYIGFHEAVELLSTSHLPKVCYNRSSVRLAVDQILRKLVLTTGGSSVMLRAVYVFQYCHVMQRKLSSDKSLPPIDTTPSKLKSLETMLVVLPSDVDLPERMNHLRNLCTLVLQLLGGSVAMTTKLDLWLLVVGHRHWYHQALIGALSQDPEERGLCRQFVDWFHNPTFTVHPPESAVELCIRRIESKDVLRGDQRQYHQALYLQLMAAHAALSLKNGQEWLQQILALVHGGELCQVAFLLEMMESFSYNIDDQGRKTILIILHQLINRVNSENEQDLMDVRRRIDAQQRQLDSG